MIGHKVESELMLLFSCGYSRFNMTISDFKPNVCRIFQEKENFFNPDANDLGKSGNYETDDCSNLPAGQLT